MLSIELVGINHYFFLQQTDNSLQNSDPRSEFIYCNFKFSRDLGKKHVVLVNCTLTSTKQLLQQHHITKLMMWYLNKIQE